MLLNLSFQGIAVSKFDKDDKQCIVRPYNPASDSNPNEVSRALKIVSITDLKSIVLEYRETSM